MKIMIGCANGHTIDFEIEEEVALDFAAWWNEKGIVPLRSFCFTEGKSYLFMCREQISYWRLLDIPAVRWKSFVEKVNKAIN